MKELKKLLNSLKSLWGILASAALLFPGAAALLKLPVAVEESQIAGLYLVVPPLVAAFSLLLLSAFSDSLIAVSSARRTAIGSMVVGLACFFAFLAVRNVFLDVQSIRNIPATDSRPSHVISRKKGLVRVEYPVPTDSPHSGDAEQYGDPWDIPALALYAGAIVSFTLSFAALGIHFHTKDTIKSA